MGQLCVVDELPDSLKAQVPVDTVSTSLPSDSSLVTSRPVKKKPMKNRSPLSNRTISTTPSATNETEDPSVRITLKPEAIVATIAKTTDGTTTSSTTTTKKPRPLYDYTKGIKIITESTAS